jgi:tetratricopeptide (TPR) repeat protein
LQPLSTLVGLHTLDLSGCEKLSNLQPLSTLVGLHTLNLSLCRELTDLRPLSVLVGLHTLRLYSCSELSVLRPLSSLVALNDLDLSTIGMELCQVLGKPAEAEPLLRRVLEARKRTLGADHADTLTSAMNLGMALHDQGRLAEAEPLLRPALEARERTLGAHHADTLMSVCKLGMLLKAQGKLAEAEPLLRRALEARLLRHEARLLRQRSPPEQLNSVSDDETLTLMSNLAELLQDQGKLAEAELLHRRVIEARERHHLETIAAFVGDGSWNIYASGKLGIALLKRSKSDQEGRELVIRGLARLRSPPDPCPEHHHWVREWSEALV